MLEQCCNHSKQCRNNAVMLCCAKNRCCELCNITLKVMLRDDSQHKCDPYYICVLPRITFETGFYIWHQFLIKFGTLITFATNSLLHFAPIITFGTSTGLQSFFPLFNELFVMLINISMSQSQFFSCLFQVIEVKLLSFFVFNRVLFFLSV